VRIAADGLPEGWFFPDDIRAYVDAISRLPNQGRVVEIGTWLGRSLAAILPTAIARHAGVWCVDTWQGSPEDPTEQLVKSGLDAFASFEANMRYLRLWGTFSVVRADETLAGARFPDGSLDLVFLDADHRYEAVIRDIRLWWPKIRPGGLFLGHDYGSVHPGVARAVNEVFREPDEVTGYVWRVRKPPEEGGYFRARRLAPLS
jgi:SAM-dependent methyltransferase